MMSQAEWDNLQLWMNENILQHQPTIIPRTFSGSSATDLIRSEKEDEIMEDEKDNVIKAREKGDKTNGEKEETKGEEEEIRCEKGISGDDKNAVEISLAELQNIGKLKLTQNLNSDKVKPKPTIIGNIKCNYDVEKLKPNLTIE